MRKILIMNENQILNLFFTFYICPPTYHFSQKTRQISYPCGKLPLAPLTLIYMQYGKKYITQCGKVLENVGVWSRSSLLLTPTRVISTQIPAEAYVPSCHDPPDTQTHECFGLHGTHSGVSAWLYLPASSSFQLLAPGSRQFSRIIICKDPVIA